MKHMRVIMVRNKISQKQWKPLQSEHIGNIWKQLRADVDTAR